MNPSPDYSDNDPRGWCGDPKRGAAMGRPSLHATARHAPIKLHLRRVYLNAGGYDRNGTYFGCGAPLYWVADGSGEVDFILRLDARRAYTDDRALARLMVSERYPHARFYR